MLASSQNARAPARVCIRCAFRMRLRHLQQQRQPASSAAASVAAAGPDAFSRYTHPVEPRPTSAFTAVRTVCHPEQRPRQKLRRGSAATAATANTANTANTARGSAATATSASCEGLIRKFLQNAARSRPSLDLGGFRNREPPFRDTLAAKLSKVKDEVENAPVLEQVAKEKAEWDGQKKKETFSRLWHNFTAKMMHPGAGEQASGVGGDARIWHDLLSTFRQRGHLALEDRIKYHFYEHVTGSRFTTSDIMNQKRMADLRYPSEWFPATRAMRRTIHLHVGPTNSGKTYHALQRLEQADTGVYAGPLRLLAHEVYTRLNAKGRRCALVTGEEIRAATKDSDDPVWDTTSCTVEMTPLNMPMDVAVIDEIQMIGNADRGWAWTQALLGVMAKEVHLCGEERTVPLIKEICASVGEELVIHRYERLSPLQVAHKSLDGDLKKLRKGDCVIAFSVMGIHALRRQIEKSTGRKVATVYGSLPPETRAQQARLFNDPNNDYDILVASDAVGMGLNLAIKRIVFESSSKFNGYQRQTLNIADIKQIGGRAGRFRTAAQAAEAPASASDLAAAAKGQPRPDRLAESGASAGLGLVTTLERFDFPIVRSAMAAEPEPIRSAGLYPPAPVLERFAGYFPPGTPFSYILARLHELSQTHSRYHLCGLKDHMWIADLIESVEGLSVPDRNILTSCPASKADTDMWSTLLPAYARCIANQSGGDITDIHELPLEMLETETRGSRTYLRGLEQLHKGIVVYLWLSYRFAGIFHTRQLAFHVKKLVEEKIEKTLGQFSFSESQRRSLAAKREKEMLESLMQNAEAASSSSSSSSSLAPPPAELDPRAPAPAETPARDDAPPAPEPSHPPAPHLAAQTSRIGGGDGFAGEEIALDEPDLEPEPAPAPAPEPVARDARSRRAGETGDDEAPPHPNPAAPAPGSV